jgi:hypothetical protein
MYRITGDGGRARPPAHGKVQTVMTMARDLRLRYPIEDAYHIFGRLGT